MRFSAFAAALVMWGCVSTPDDPLVWSDNVARSLPRETGEVIEVARFSSLHPGSALAPWEAWFVQRGNTPTAYRAAEVDGVVAVEADAQAGGSALWRKVRLDPHSYPVIEWRWRVAPEPSTKLEKNSPSSPLARLSLGFHGDVNKLDFDDRAKLRLAMSLTPNGLPYASLLYVWMLNVPAETVLHSPYTDRVRMIVVESGAQRVGQWVTVRRNVLEDYRRAFGERPDDVVGVGLMTDPGDDGSRRRSFYGDITFRSSK